MYMESLVLYLTLPWLSCGILGKKLRIPDTLRVHLCTVLEHLMKFGFGIPSYPSSHKKA